MTEDIKDEWYAFELEEFPPACEGRTWDGMSWEQVDAMTAACISFFIQSGPLDKEGLDLLDQSMPRLEGIVTEVEEDHKPYFGKLLDLARRVREASAR